jgi:hypothetical protein
MNNYPLPEKGKPVSLEYLTRLLEARGTDMAAELDELRLMYAVGYPCSVPEKPFVWDGASCFPDKVGDCNTDEATFRHDVRYWMGIPGNEGDRAVADFQFGIDLIEQCHASAALADLMVRGVRVGGASHSPFPWRYGYGRVERKNEQTEKGTNDE